MLDKQQPEEAGRFDPNECLNFQYHYPVLPEGLLPRFIVRTHVLSAGQPRWRTGVILDFEGCRALVKADKEDKRVFVNVEGPNGQSRRELLSIIRYDFEHINRSFTFKPLEMIPVPAAPEVLVPYQELVVMERNGIKAFPKVADGQVLELNVEDLLNGVDLAGTRKSTEAPTRTEAVRVFCSYSHRDDELRAELANHVKLLERQGIIDVWHDRRIPPGNEWKHEIDDQLEQADLILLLVSSEFMASDYCYEKEMKRALARQDAGEATVVPIILSDVDWQSAELARLQALPEDGKPVTKWGADRYARDSAWKQVAVGLRDLVMEKRAQGPAAASVQLGLKSAASPPARP